MLADDPHHLSQQVLGTHVAKALSWKFCDPDPPSGKARRENSICPTPPNDLPPHYRLQHGLRRDRLCIGNVLLARAIPFGNGEDHLHTCWKNLLLERNANGPGQPACAQRLPQSTTQAIFGMGKDATKRAPATRIWPRVAKAHCSQFEAYASNRRVTQTRVLKNNGCGKSELCKITATYQTKTRSTSWRYPRKHANVAGNVTLIKNCVNQLQCNI